MAETYRVLYLQTIKKTYEFIVCFLNFYIYLADKQFNELLQLLDLEHISTKSY